MSCGNNSWQTEDFYCFPGGYSPDYEDKSLHLAKPPIIKEEPLSPSHDQPPSHFPSTPGSPSENEQQSMSSGAQSQKLSLLLQHYQLQQLRQQQIALNAKSLQRWEWVPHSEDSPSAAVPQILSSATVSTPEPQAEQPRKPRPYIRRAVPQPQSQSQQSGSKDEDAPAPLFPPPALRSSSELNLSAQLHAQMKSLQHQLQPQLQLQAQQQSEIQSHHQDKQPTTTLNPPLIFPLSKNQISTLSRPPALSTSTSSSPSPISSTSLSTSNTTTTTTRSQQPLETQEDTPVAPLQRVELLQQLLQQRKEYEEEKRKQHQHLRFPQIQAQEPQQGQQPKQQTPIIPLRHQQELGQEVQEQIRQELMQLKKRKQQQEELEQQAITHQDRLKRLHQKLQKAKEQQLQKATEQQQPQEQQKHNHPQVMPQKQQQKPNFQLLDLLPHRKPLEQEQQQRLDRYPRPQPSPQQQRLDRYPRPQPSQQQQDSPPHPPPSQRKSSPTGSKPIPLLQQQTLQQPIQQLKPIVVPSKRPPPLLPLPIPSQQRHHVHDDDDHQPIQRSSSSELPTLPPISILVGLSVGMLVRWSGSVGVGKLACWLVVNSIPL